LYVGVRNMFYRAATIFGAGLDRVPRRHDPDAKTGSATHAWSQSMALLAVLFFGFGLWPRVGAASAVRGSLGRGAPCPEFVREFLATFGSFFRRAENPHVLGFLLLYRFGEAQLVKMVSPFLLDPRAQGGLGLTTAQVGIVYGTFGILALTVGGVLGGLVAARDRPP